MILTAFDCRATCLQYSTSPMKFSSDVMSTNRQTLSPTYFEDLYAKDRDPWRFASSDYERRKYADTLAALSGRRFHAAFEVGCSIGIFTRQLAPQCDSLLAVDVVEQALQQARQNCKALNQVKIERMQSRAVAGVEHGLGRPGKGSTVVRLRPSEGAHCRARSGTRSS